MEKKKYAGIYVDTEGSMNATDNVIRDAWVFGIIPETETCEGWLMQGVIELYDRVAEAWEPYGGIPSRLPPELREKHQRIYDEAVKFALEHGWNPDESLKNK